MNTAAKVLILVLIAALPLQVFAGLAPCEHMAAGGVEGTGDTPSTAGDHCAHMHAGMEMSSDTDPHDLDSGPASCCDGGICHCHHCGVSALFGAVQGPRVPPDALLVNATFVNFHPTPLPAPFRPPRL